MSTLDDDLARIDQTHRSQRLRLRIQLAAVMLAAGGAASYAHHGGNWWLVAAFFAWCAGMTFTHLGNALEARFDAERRALLRAAIRSAAGDTKTDDQTAGSTAADDTTPHRRTASREDTGR